MNTTAGFLMLICGIILTACTMGVFLAEGSRRQKKVMGILCLLFVLFGWLVFPWIGLGVEKVWYWNMALVNNHDPRVEVTPPVPIKLQAPIREATP